MVLGRCLAASETVGWPSDNWPIHWTYQCEIFGNAGWLWFWLVWSGMCTTTTTTTTRYFSMNNLQFFTIPNMFARFHRKLVPEELLQSICCSKLQKIYPTISIGFLFSIDTKLPGTRDSIKFEDVFFLLEISNFYIIILLYNATKIIILLNKLIFIAFGHFIDCIITVW